MRFVIWFIVGSVYVSYLYILKRLLDILDEPREDIEDIREKLPPCYEKVEARNCFKSKDECFECMMGCLDSIEDYLDEDIKRGH